LSKNDIQTIFVIKIVTTSSVNPKHEFSQPAGYFKEFPMAPSQPQRTWFITGTSTGFGYHLTELLLARGDRVAATARNLQALGALKEKYGNQLWTEKLDVTDTAAVRQVVERAFKELGRIDVICSNAGYGLFGAVEEVSDGEIKHQFDTNIVGSIQLIRATLPHLRAQGGGRILQLSSMGGQIAFPTLGLYHATKWAMEGLCESLIAEVAAFNIQVTIVEPGGARTDFGGRSAVMGPGLPAYADTVVGQMRKGRANPDISRIKGDPVKMAQAMIDSVDLEKAPKRLTLGSDAYTMVRAALVQRLADLDAQKDLAFSTDIG
jgi:NAD(P)-dependent dehydrogenase (short-subunit alcohol dehydrogenase family)